MIPLVFLEYELPETPDNVLNQLKWSVEEVEVSWLDNFANWKTKPDTHKNWTGEIDRQNLRFSLEESGPLFNQRLNVVLKGKLELRASSTNLKIKVGLDNFSSIWIFMLYLGGILFLSDAFTNKEFDSYFSLFFFLIAYPLLGTFLIRKRMKRTELKLDQLFA
jgi:hypothetical protein